MNPNIIGIRFQEIGKIYHFDATGFDDISVGDFVIVETSRGRQLGEVALVLDHTDPNQEGSWKPILRKATPRDLVLRQVWEAKETEAIEICRSELKKLKIKGVKIISAEYSLDGKRLLFQYNSEGDESVDLEELKRALKNHIRQTRIEIRQIGPRDAAKIIGGMGACGIAERCCCRFLVEFSPISIRMAKAQNVSLSPSEITGMCGRLRCCLIYEYDQYVQARKDLPREKKRVVTPMGEGKVVSVSPLVRRILVHLGDAGLKEFSVDELINENQSQPASTESSATQSENDADRGDDASRGDDAPQKGKRKSYRRGRNSSRRKRKSK